EGPNGVGKTSLVNVAAYNCLRNYLSGGTTQLLIPCRRAFQLSSNVPIDDFIQEIFYEVAQTLIERANSIRGIGLALEGKEALNRWLNSATLNTWSGGVSAVALGGGQAANGSDGFSRS